MVYDTVLTGVIGTHTPSKAYGGPVHLAFAPSMRWIMGGSGISGIAVVSTRGEILRKIWPILWLYLQGAGREVVPR